MQASAPLGIDSVAWPTDAARIKALLTSLPRSLDRWTSSGVQSEAAPESFSRTYKDDSGQAHYPYVYVTRTTTGETPASSMMSLLMWAGGPQGCIDWKSSASLAALPHATSDKDLGAIVSAVPSGSHELLWFECTSVINIDGGPGTLPPGEWDYLLVWAAGDWVYTVDGRGDTQRATMTGRLTAGATKAP